MDHETTESSSPSPPEAPEAIMGLSTPSPPAEEVDPLSLPDLNQLYRDGTLRPATDPPPLAYPYPALNALISLHRGDLLSLRATAIIVDSPPPFIGPLRPSRALARAAGPSLEPDLARHIGHFLPGATITTRGYDLPAPWIVHAFGPSNANGVTPPGVEGRAHTDLGQCYVNALRCAELRRWPSLAFACVGTSHGRFPSSEAAMVACRQIRRCVSVESILHFDRIVFVVDNDVDFRSYCEWIPRFFPPLTRDSAPPSISDETRGRTGNPQSNGHANGRANGHATIHHDDVLLRLVSGFRSGTS